MAIERRFAGVASEIWQGDALEVAQLLPDGSCTLAIVDGPYAMDIGPDWDALTVAELPEWYRPHLEQVDRVCAESASLYIWNRAEGWATLHPHLVAAGWQFQSLIHWTKTNGMALRSAHPRGAKKWIDLTEVCGFYRRGEVRPFFEHPRAISNVWRHTRIRGSARLYDDEGGKMHACQKPVAFARRMLVSSMAAGEQCWVPFGGTCREALAAELIAKADPAEARRVVVAELNADGKDYIGAAIRQIQGNGNQRPSDEQVTMFGS